MRKGYLAGYIAGSVLDKCIYWRNKIKRECKECVWIDPINMTELKDCSPDGLKTGCAPLMILQRDYMSVKECDFLVANLDRFGLDRPMVGTLFEIAWAFAYHKPIIVITDDNSYINHPFINTTCVLVKTVEEAIKLIDNYM